MALDRPGPVNRGADPLVLVADNDKAVSTLLQEVLARSGLRTAAVADGAAALRFLEHREVALLVCDLDMPEMGGREVLRRLDELGDPPPALVVSGFLDEALESELRGRRAVRGLYRKPFDVIAFAEAAAQIAREGRGTVHQGLELGL